jgi:hypothetical protein
LPDDSGHFISVHVYYWLVNLNFLAFHTDIYVKFF